MATPDSLDRLSNIVATLAHPHGDHADNDLEDEAHDIIRELRDVLSTAPITTFMVRCNYCGHLPCDCTERVR